MPAKKASTVKPATAKATKAKPVTPKTVKPKPSVAKEEKPERTDVFISYSHADKEWLSRLQVHLKPLERDHKIAIWADTKLRGGDKWRIEIDKALAKAKVAILLISADFMASDFIAGNELPPLLKAAENDGVLILPIIIGHSGGFTISSLSQFQALNDPVQPVEDMLKGEANKVFTQVFKRVYAAFQQQDLTPVKRARVAATEPAITTRPLKKPTRSITVSPMTKPANSSTAKKALLVKQNGDWEVVTVTHSQLASTDLMMVVKATTPAQRAFLLSLRQADQLSSVVFDLQTHVCRNVNVHFQTEGTRESWHIKTAVQLPNRRAEVTYGSTTPDKQAEIRARLLLLDELPVNDQSPFSYLFGVTQLNNGHSPLPTLYQQLNRQLAAFKQTAPLIITWFLQTHYIVDTIHTLTFTLKGDQATVRFDGVRGSQYQHEAPTLINVKGTCDLTKTVPEKILRLSPLNR